MTTTLNLTLPVKVIPWAVTRGDVITSAGNFSIGFDNGYIINNGRRYKIGCRDGYEYIRKTHAGRRKYINARVMLAFYLPEGQ